MVSKYMRMYGMIAEVLNQKEYRELEGLLKECLPNHVPIDIERVGNKIKLWSDKPLVMRRALKRARDMHKKYGTDAMSKIWQKEVKTKIKKITPKKKKVVKRKTIKRVVKRPKKKRVIKKKILKKKTVKRKKK
ncbi:MAG: hypothetical protein KKG75_01315 [Nanoarchaeota archaeon]|nr:hypothetical protein [Nanoarchaeota archaeon]